ncbi:MAG: hypothetical protein IPJ34_37125 [Myxococcales bacterium]|nr:hypothetical protein [Myxococcales bacterium]
MAEGIGGFGISSVGAVSSGSGATGAASAGLRHPDRRHRVLAAAAGAVRIEPRVGGAGEVAGARELHLLGAARVEGAVAQGDDHRLVLLLHHLLDHLAHHRVAHVRGVGGLDRLQDASAIREEVRDDVRMLDARVLGLDVIDLPLVLEVVVEPEEGRGGLHGRPRK